MNASEARHTLGLAQRLSEAEATIEALLSGEIDAVVDSRSNKPVLLFRAQEALRESEERFRAVAELAQDAIISATSDRRITFWNRSAEKMFGYTTQEILGKSSTILLGKWFGHIEEHEMLGRGSRARAGDSAGILEIDARHKDGHEFPVEISSSSWTRNGERVFTSAMRDISERRRLQAELLRHLQVDHLTGLLVRCVGEERITIETNRARRHRRPLAIGLFDIDHFKLVNDVHGHAVGDAVLAHIGQAVNRLVRTSDVAVRWGGEELLIAMPETTLEGALECAERVRHAVSELDVTTIGPITISAGVAAHVGDEGALDTVRRADARLYEAKRLGRNRVLA